MPYQTLPLGTHDAVVELLVGVNVARRDNLTRSGFPVPPRRRVRAQVDTGTSFTAIDASVLASFGIGSTEVIEIRTPSPTGASQFFRRFPVSIGLNREGLEMLLTSLEVVECVFGPDED